MAKSLDLKARLLILRRLCQNKNMIEVERMNGQKIWINPNYIKSLESAPDTVVTMHDGEKLLLKTTCSELIKKITAARAHN